MPDYRLENAIADLDAVYVENEEDRESLGTVLDDSPAFHDFAIFT